MNWKIFRVRDGRLAVSERTLRRRTRAICDVLGVPAATTAVAWAARQGLR
jgi:hypothetical protein